MIYRARGSGFQPRGLGPGMDGDTGNGTGPDEVAWPQAIPVGLSHRIYPDGHAVAVISGELDAATADQAFEYVCQVIDRSRGPVCIDLAGLSFCDARGLRTLIGAAAHARAAAGGSACPACARHRQDHVYHGGRRELPELCQPGSRASRLEGSRGRGHSARNPPSPY